MDAQLNTFLKVLDSSDTSVGGGSASAIAGAMAAALVAMVARLSIGKEGMKEDVFYRDILEEADALSAALLHGADEDEAAFAAVRAAYRLPKDVALEKVRRQQAIQDAMIQAARVPLNNAERCYRVLELYAELYGCSNSNAASDLECARYLAHAGALGGVANVLINIPAIKDESIAIELRTRAQALKEMVG